MIKPSMLKIKICKKLHALNFFYCRAALN